MFRRRASEDPGGCWADWKMSVARLRASTFTWAIIVVPYPPCRNKYRSAFNRDVRGERYLDGSTGVNEILYILSTQGRLCVAAHIVRILERAKTKGSNFAQEHATLGGSILHIQGLGFYKDDDGREHQTASEIITIGLRFCDSQQSSTSARALGPWRGCYCRGSLQSTHFACKDLASRARSSIQLLSREL
jgi:hypothetical protein